MHMHTEAHGLHYALLRANIGSTMTMCYVNFNVRMGENMCLRDGNGKWRKQ